MGTGVAGAIKRAGGQSIEDEAVRKGPVSIGEAVVTLAGRLPARYVIHAAVMGQDLSTDADKIHAATLNSLRRADELQLKSVAFPALGTGVGGFPLSRSADVMISAVREHLAGPTSLDRVVFALFGAEAYHVFEEALRR
jgi:O-acetyl-ADP-ribose deacetylase